MSNFASLLASVRGSTSTGAAMGGTLMNVKAAQDYFKLRDLMTSLGDIKGEMGKEFIELETARGKGQLGGGILGGGIGLLLGGPWGAALGAGIGSYGGGHLATRRDVSDLAEQERAAKRSLESFGDTFFHGSKFGEAKSYGRDLSRYVSVAKTQLKDRLVKNALMDALYAYTGSKSLMKWDPSGVGSNIGSFVKSTDPEGNVLGTLEGVKAYSKAAKSKAMTAAGADVVPSLIESRLPGAGQEFMGTRGMFDVAGIGGYEPGFKSVRPLGYTLSDLALYDPSKHILSKSPMKPGSFWGREEMNPLLSSLFREPSQTSNVFSMFNK
jgi:hypothetical protein